MSRVLVFNLAGKFDLLHFARVEAVDLFRADSGVTLYDAASRKHDELSGIWPFWPKEIDPRPKSMADEILDHVRAGQSTDPLSVLYIVDSVTEVLPGLPGTSPALAQETIHLVERVIQIDHDNHSSGITQYAICLDGHRQKDQREAVIRFFDRAEADITGVFFFETGLQSLATPQESATRMIIDILLKRGSQDEGAEAFDKRRDFAFVVKMNGSVPSIGTVMRHDFSMFIEGKFKDASRQSDQDARESKEFKAIDDLISDVDKDLHAIEEKTIAPIEINVAAPDPKAPRYKTRTLLQDLDAQARRYEENIRLAAQEQIQDAIIARKNTSVESVRLEEELNARIENFAVPAMQFRWSLFQAIRSELDQKVRASVSEAQKAVTALRRTLSGYFNPDQDGVTSKSHSEADEGHQALDLSQLQKVVSSTDYWKAHQKLILAAKRLPSRGFAYSIYLATFSALFAMGYAFLMGVEQGTANYPVWQHLTLSLPIDYGGDAQSILPALMLAVFVVASAAIAFVFSRIRSPVIVAHGQFLERAAKLESDFRGLAQQTLEYSKRARTLQLRKKLALRFDESLDVDRTELFRKAADHLKLRAHEQQSLEGLELPANLLKAASLLKDETQTNTWINEYFAQTLNLKTEPLEVKIGDTHKELTFERSSFVKRAKVNFDELRDWEAQ